MQYTNLYILCFFLYLKTLIQNQDAEAILNTLTNPEVESQVLERIRIKAFAYGREPAEVSRMKKKSKLPEAPDDPSLSENEESERASVRLPPFLFLSFLFYLV